MNRHLYQILGYLLQNEVRFAAKRRTIILDTMAEVIDIPDEMSQFVPRITSVKVPVSKIGEVIGPKGKTINQITEETGAEVSPGACRGHDGGGRRRA